MLFEAGAISTLSQAYVFTFLYRVEYADVTDPLSMFNHTASRRDYVYRMVTSLNNVLDIKKISDRVLTERFERLLARY